MEVKVKDNLLYELNLCYEPKPVIYGGGAGKLEVWRKAKLTTKEAKDKRRQLKDPSVTSQQKNASHII